MNSIVEDRHPYNLVGDGPEGPEVRVVAEWLNYHYKGAEILDILYNEKSALHKSGSYSSHKIVYPIKVKGVTCKGKHIFWLCQSAGKDIYFHSHLAMTGRWTPTKGNHSNMEFICVTTIGQHRLYFDDTRRFGKFSILYSTEDYLQKVNAIGIDLLNGAIRYSRGDRNVMVLIRKEWRNLYDRMQQSVRSNQRPIFPVLMDQKKFSGIGAYVAAEMLYKTGIDPNRKIKNLSRNDIYNLFNAAFEILYASYTCGGLTIQDFWDPEGKRGVYPRKIYGHEQDPNGYQIVKSKFSNNRACQWVREIQH